MNISMRSSVYTALLSAAFISAPLIVAADTPPQACTRDAQQCPDGSTVGRTGPRCEFVCPTHTPASPTPGITINEANAQLNVLLDAFKDIQRKILALIVSMKQGASTAVDFTQIQTLLDQVRLVQEKFIGLRLSIDAHDGDRDHGNCGRGHEGDCADSSQQNSPGASTVSDEALVNDDNKHVDGTTSHRGRGRDGMCEAFTHNLSHGSRGDDVTRLQKHLHRHGMLKADDVTGFFGSHTEKAVHELQKKNGIASSTGTMGPRTRDIVRKECMRGDRDDDMDTDNGVSTENHPGGHDGLRADGTDAHDANETDDNSRAADR